MVVNEIWFGVMTPVINKTYLYVLQLSSSVVSTFLLN